MMGLHLEFLLLIVLCYGSISSSKYYNFTSAVIVWETNKNTCGMIQREEITDTSTVLMPAANLARKHRDQYVLDAIALPLPCS